MAGIVSISFWQPCTSIKMAAIIKCGKFLKWPMVERWTCNNCILILGEGLQVPKTFWVYFPDVFVFVKRLLFKNIFDHLVVQYNESIFCYISILHVGHFSRLNDKPLEFRLSNNYKTICQQYLLERKWLVVDLEVILSR